MFCRFCGTHIADDSVYCAKCGKRLGPRERPRLNKLIQTLHLKTPYPYFVLLLVLFIVWAIGPRQTRADYSNLKWSLELDKRMDIPKENLFRQSLSLVVENTGSVAVQDIPVELRAKIEPQKRGDVTAGFLGRKLLIMQQGRPLPLVVVLTDRIEANAKKRYFLEGSIEAEPPFKVTYEVREEDKQPLIASYVVEE